MNDSVLSNCEKKFIIKCLSQNTRLDGRNFNDFRNIDIQFGSEYGCVIVSLGETKVLAQVSCEITQPRATRPAEGTLFINVNCGQEKRSSEQVVLLTRNLERALKESRCVDLEWLCIKAEEKVWRIRVDVNILNHEGNLTDCASVAALAALAHFKIPDVTVNGDEIQIHSPDEREPIPIVLQHHPVCVSYAIYENGTIAIADPSFLEERRSEAMVVFGVNSYRELCGLLFGGMTLASLEVLIKCANKGAKRASIVVNQIKSALQVDEKRRSSGEHVGFLHENFAAENRLFIRLQNFKLDAGDQDEAESTESKSTTAKIRALGESSAVLMPAEELSSGDEYDDFWIPDFDGDVQIPKTSDSVSTEKNASKPKRTTIDRMSKDSEEDDTIVMGSLT